eukprot:TRINITY_DN27000_c0_g1_i1.p1 TRINITY_DN27000_c0_g1~~TRINITY_DN27000_c0_g1_i1.p1  ORF type:complete len:490 (+),score=67.53 TRINITY_DN27000_c0_g1_i1:308-1777(+)
MTVREDVERGALPEHLPLIRKGKSSRNANGREVKSGASSSAGSDVFAILSTLVVALGPVSFGFSIGFSSPTQAGITSDLDLTISQFSLYGSVVNVGAMFGAITSGKIADRVGRKWALVVAAVPHLVGWAMTIFSTNIFVLDISRLLVGYGVGVISFAVPIYIAEIAPRHLRGGLGTMNQLAVTVGILLAYLGGLVLNWRELAAAGLIPCTLLLIGLIFIPESPRWLVKVGSRDQEAPGALQCLRGSDYDISSELKEMIDAVEEAKLQPASQFSDLFRRRLFRPLLAGVGLQLLQQFGGINAIMFYASEIFRSVGFTSPNAASLGIGVLQVVMTGVAAGIMDKAGRRLLLMVSAGGMAASCFLVGFSFYLKEHTNVMSSSSMGTYVSMLALTSLLVYIIAFSLGMGAIPWIVMSEIFPANVKGLAGSLATLANWFAAWTVTMVFNFMLQWSSVGSFWIFAGECALTVVFVALFVPETRGRTLEEIEASFQ